MQVIPAGRAISAEGGMAVHRGDAKLSCHDQPARRGVSSQAPNGARQAVGTHHGPTRIHVADYSLRHRRDGKQRWHYDTLSSPHRPPPALVLSDDCGLQGAVGRWAPPPLPQGPQDLPRDYGPDGAAGGLSRSTLRRADHATTGAGQRPGLGAKLPATSNEARAGWYIARLLSGSFQRLVGS